MTVKTKSKKTTTTIEPLTVQNHPGIVAARTEYERACKMLSDAELTLAAIQSEDKEIMDDLAELALQGKPLTATDKDKEIADERLRVKALERAVSLKQQALEEATREAAHDITTAAADTIHGHRDRWLAALQTSLAEYDAMAAERNKLEKAGVLRSSILDIPNLSFPRNWRNATIGLIGHLRGEKAI